MAFAAMDSRVERYDADRAIASRTHICASSRRAIPCSRSGGHQFEFDGGRVFGIEIKATAAPSIKDARHLRWMRDERGSPSAGVSCSTPARRSSGSTTTSSALPIASVWGARMLPTEL